MPQKVSANGGLSSTGARCHMLPIQTLVLSHGCASPCREPLLIGNVPSACFLAPLLVLLPHASCTCRGLFPVCTRSGSCHGPQEPASTAWDGYLGTCAGGAVPHHASPARAGDR